MKPDAISMLYELKDKIVLGSIQMHDVDIVNTLIQMEEEKMKNPSNQESISAEGILIPAEGNHGGITITNSVVNFYWGAEGAALEDLGGRE